MEDEYLKHYFKVSGGGRITLPKEIKRMHNIKPGDKVLIEYKILKVIPEHEQEE